MAHLKKISNNISYAQAIRLDRYLIKTLRFEIIISLIKQMDLFIKEASSQDDSP